MTTGTLEDLQSRLQILGDVGVAVSGGVDSMTLAVVVHRLTGVTPTMFHAVSPAVPAEATDRVRRYSAVEGWDLQLVDAGEFTDERYLRNPADRCLFCKTNLYDTIAAQTSRQVISGTNTDDLTDYRPGLQAADDHHVRHPFVEAGVDKSGVRAIARRLGLHDLSELPGAPCLSSRIETGIRIQPITLHFVENVERELTASLQPRLIRCRVHSDRVVIELDEDTLVALDTLARQTVRECIATLWTAKSSLPPIEFGAYRRGSAFLRTP
jgi:pyridinium-3,5-biscarboxylic acid mononucleotide sulfurtransferase